MASTNSGLSCRPGLADAGPGRSGGAGPGCHPGRRGSHSLGVRADGSVVAWGENLYGQCTVPAAAQSGVIAVAAGGCHSLALKADGSVVAWGDNATASAPSRLQAQSGVIAVAAGGFHSLALKADGSVVAWGDNDYGQCTVPAAAQSGVSPWPPGAATAWP